MEETSFDLTGTDLDRLADEAFFVRDSFLSHDICRILRREIEHRARAGGLEQAGTGRGQNYQQDHTIRGDYINWLDRDTGDYPWDLVLEQFEQLRVGLNRRGFLGLNDCEIQVARYPGDGSGYDRHLDAFAGDATRRVTAITYLNETWRPSDGGALRLYPEDGSTIDIEPVAGRLVVFLSKELEHGVRPAFAPRFAVTSWYRSSAPFRVAI